MTKKIEAQIEKLPQSQVKLTITVPATEMESFIAKAAEELSKNMKLDGFRPGKIPRDVVERTLGSDALLHEGAEKAVKKYYVDAILDNKVEAIGQPKVELKKIALGNDLVFDATVGVMPEVKLGDWTKKVQSINADFKKQRANAKVDDKEIERELDYLAKQRAKTITVNREAKKGDQVEIDFEVWKGGAPIEGGTAKKHLLVLGEGRFIPGFEEKLVGSKANDSLEFELTFPADYHEKNLAGQKSKFKVKLNLVQERQVPAIDDAFASSIGKFKDLAELKENIRHGIAHENSHKLEEQQKRQILEELVAKIEAELPEVLVEIELARMADELDQEVSSIGLEKAAYFQHLKTTEEQLRQQWKEKAAPDRVKAALALRQLAKEKDIKPSSAEIEERMNKYLQYYKSVGDIEKDLDLERLYDTVKGNLTNDKVLHFLMEQ